MLVHRGTDDRLLSSVRLLRHGGCPRLSVTRNQARIPGIAGALVRKRTVGAGGLMRGDGVDDSCASIHLSELIETFEFGFGEGHETGLHQTGKLLCFFLLSGKVASFGFFNLGSLQGALSDESGSPI